LVEEIGILDTEVGESVVVHGNAAAEPAIGEVFGTEAGEFASGADAVDGGEEPEGEEKTGVVGIATGEALEGTNGSEERGEVETGGEIPDEACGVVWGEELVKGTGERIDEGAIGGP
jgi:hypothetical protein